MPIVVDCPSCSRKLRVPDDMLGKKVKCPRCGGIFAASANDEPEPDREEEERPPPKKSSSVRERPSEAGKRTPRPPEPEEELAVDEEEPAPRRRPRPAAEEEDGDDRPRRRTRAEDGDDEDFYRPRRRRSERGANYRQVSRGLTMILLSVLLPVIALVIFITGMLIIGGAIISSLTSGTGPGGRPVSAPSGGEVAAAGIGMIVLVLLLLLMMLASWVLKILGHIFCLPSPDKHGARILAMVTLGLVGGSAVLWLLSQGVSFLEVGLAASSPFSYGGSGASGLISILSSLLAVAGWLVFMFYIRSLALAVHARGLASNVVYYLISVGVSIVVTTLSACIVPLILGASVAAAASRNANRGGPPNVEGFAALGVMFFICVGVFVLLWLGLFVWYVVILVQARSAVTYYMLKKA